MRDNLPPNVTPSDIDRHFGEAETEEIVGHVIIGYYMDTDEKIKDPKEHIRENLEYSNAGEISHIDIKQNTSYEIDDERGYELIAEVYLEVASEVPRHYSTDDVKKELMKKVEVENDSEVAEIHDVELHPTF